MPSFPHLPALVSCFSASPLLLFSNVNPAYPGLAGMMASAGALAQTGTPYVRAYGDTDQSEIAAL